MKKLLLLLLCSAFYSLQSNAQILSIRPDSAIQGQNLRTTITLANGLISSGTPPSNYQDIYLEQGGNIIYPNSSYSPIVNVYNTTFPTLQFRDSLFVDWNFSPTASLGYYNLHFNSYDNSFPPVMTPNVLPNAFYIRPADGRMDGDVFFDYNQNGIRDAVDIGFSNVRLTRNPGGWTALTDANGHYTFTGLAGTYNIGLNISAPTVQTTTPLSYNATIPPSATGLDFGVFRPFYSTSQHYASLSSRRCSTLTTLYMSFYNQTPIGIQVQVSVIYSSNLTFINSTYPSTVVTGDTLTFDIASILPGNAFNLYSNQINFLNPAAGQTVYMTVIDSVFNLGGAFLYAVQNNIQNTISCSYDPNEKIVSPAGIGTPHFTPMDSTLHYQINFQNTGNDTALNIIIIDTLDANLDWSTFEINGSTDQVTAEISPTGVVKFSFYNIYLPDSIVDEPGSHGSVFYQIKPNAGLPDPTVITNTSYIIFDYNDPVITNTTLNTMSNTLPPVANFNASNLEVCQGSCIQFDNTSTSGTNFSWYFQGANSQTSVLQNPLPVCYSTPGVYAVSLIASNSLGTDTLIQSAYITVNPSPAAVSVSQSGDTLIAGQGYDSYQWYFNNDSIIGATNYYYVATTSGDYGVAVGNQFGCFAGANIPSVIASTNDQINSNSISIFPNPSTGEFEVIIFSKGNDKLKLSLMSLIGQEVYTMINELNVGVNQFTIKDQNLSSGVYLLKGELSTGNFVKRILIK